MTTEPCPVVPGHEDLRKRLIDLMARDPQFASFTLAADVARVDAILDTIEAAGLAIVATDRWEHLLKLLVDDQERRFPDPIEGGAE